MKQCVTALWGGGVTDGGWLCKLRGVGVLSKVNQQTFKEILAYGYGRFVSLTELTPLVSYQFYDWQGAEISVSAVGYQFCLYIMSSQCGGISFLYRRERGSYLLSPAALIIPGMRCGV